MLQRWRVPPDERIRHHASDFNYSSLDWGISASSSQVIKSFCEVINCIFPTRLRRICRKEPIYIIIYLYMYIIFITWKNYFELGSKNWPLYYKSDWYFVFTKCVTKYQWCWGSQLESLLVIVTNFENTIGEFDGPEICPFYPWSSKTTR